MKSFFIFLCSFFSLVSIFTFCSQKTNEKKELFSHVAYQWLKNGSESFVVQGEDFRLSACGSKVKVETPFNLAVFDDKDVDSLLRGICLHGGLIVTSCRKKHNTIDPLSKFFATVFCKGGEPSGVQFFCLFSDGSEQYRYSNNQDNNFAQEARELLASLPALRSACIEWKEHQKKEKKTF